MSQFNYVKAFYGYAKPAVEKMNYNQLNAISKIVPLIGELHQGRNLDIPMTPAIKDNLNMLSTKELAELARAVYFYGHWKPSDEDLTFNNSRGESWKIANCADQILRERLGNIGYCQIHEGKLRVTFSNKDCWLWEEFGLATEENYQRLKDSGLPFSETTLHESALKLACEIGDLWDSENIPDTPDYVKELEAEKIRAIEANKKSKAR